MHLAYAHLKLKLNINYVNLIFESRVIVHNFTLITDAFSVSFLLYCLVMFMVRLKAIASDFEKYKILV